MYKPKEEPMTIVKNEIVTKNILLVEDNFLNGKLASKIIELAGYPVLWLKDGTEVIEWVKNNPDDYSIILMDIQMPMMDGLTATKELRHSGVTNPIIAMTAHAMDGDETNCINSGMDDYITKPISISKFKALLEKWLGK